MTVAWDGLQTILAEDVAAADPQITVVFADGFAALTPPFDIAIGLERMTVTAMGGTDDTVWDVTREVNGTPADVYFAGGGVTELRHEYLITQLDASTIDLTAIAQTVRHSYGIPGGELQAVIEFDTYDLARYVPDPDAAFIMRSNWSGTWKPYFSGLVGRPSYTARDDGGYHVTMIARGYANTLGWDMYTQITDPTTLEGVYLDNGYGSWGAYTPIHTVVEHVRNDLCPLISNANTHVTDGAQQLGRAYNGYLKTPKQIIDDLTAQGDLGSPLDWAVYTNEDDEPELWLSIRERWPVITVPWGILDPDGVVLPREVPLAWDTDDQKTKIIVKFAKGHAESRAATGRFTKTVLFDETNTIDDLSTAQYLADRIKNEASVLQLITEAPIVFEYKADDPATKYLTDSGGNEIPIWEFRAGWVGEFDGLAAVNANLPITQVQAKTVDVDHNARTATVQFGKFDDYAKLVGQFNHQDAGRPDSPVHTPGNSGNVAVTPPGVPVSGGLGESVSSLGANGRVGYDAVAEDADIQAVAIFAAWNDDGVTPLPTGRLPDFWIPMNVQIMGFRLIGGAGSDPSSATVVIGYGTLAVYSSTGGPGATVATLSPSAVRTYQKDLSDNPGDAEPQFRASVTDFISAEITANTGFTRLTCLMLYRRLGGAEKPASSGAPTISGIAASRDAGNIVHFAVVANKLSRMQIEYAASDSYLATAQYTARTAKTEVLATAMFLNVPGLPPSFHYQVHVWDADGNETVSDDHVL